MASTRRSLIVLTSGISLALTACGGAGNGAGAGTAPVRTSTGPEATVAASGPEQARHKPPAITTGKSQPTRARSTEPAEKSQSANTGLNPCKLVTRAEAQAIVGGRVAVPSLAPQGPTCVYATAKQSITLALQDLQASAAAKASRSTIKVKVGGKPAYCIDDGGLRMLVPLDSGKTLVVAAACPVAARFATEALRRLGT